MTTAKPADIDIEAERKAFAAIKRAKMHAKDHARNDTDEQVCGYYADQFAGWIAAKRAALHQGEPAFYVRREAIDTLASPLYSATGTMLFKDPGDGRIAVYAAPPAQVAPLPDERPDGWTYLDGYHHTQISFTNPMRKSARPFKYIEAAHGIGHSQGDIGSAG